MFGRKKICIGCEKQVKKVDDLQLCESCRKDLDMAVNRHIEIIDDCIRIINNTKNMDTFFGRIKTFTDCVNQLKGYMDMGYKIDPEVPNRCKALSDSLPDKAVELVSARAKAVRERKRKSDKPYYNYENYSYCSAAYSKGIDDMQTELIKAYRSYIATGTPPIENILQLYYGYKRWVVTLKGGADYLVRELSRLKEPDRACFCWADTVYFLEVDYTKDKRR